MSPSLWSRVQRFRRIRNVSQQPGAGGPPAPARLVDTLRRPTLACVRRAALSLPGHDWKLWEIHPGGRIA
jgi:hypothetical protein